MGARSDIFEDPYKNNMQNMGCEIGTDAGYQSMLFNCLVYIRKKYSMSIERVTQFI